MEYDEILQMADRIFDELVDVNQLRAYTHGFINGKFSIQNGTPESTYVLAALRRISDDGYMDKKNGSSETFHINGKTFNFKKSGGYEELIKEENRRAELKAVLEDLGLKNTQSVIDTNTSIQQLNTSTVRFYSKQKTHNTINIFLTIAIMFATVVSGGISTCSYYDIKAENQKKAQDKSDLQLKVEKLESVLQSKVAEDSVFQKAVKDSLNIP
ncbi:hypothetical protein [Flavobacterium sp.]|uniref:hypothetical protein n=1 Tax=Flavobacterium sp. TaxID=239 RepID=UPI00374D2799